MNRFNCMTNRRSALARCDASDLVRRHGLYGQCVACGAIVCDWRQLIGVGARLATCANDPETVVLTHPGACGACGGSELAIGALGATAQATGAPIGMLVALLGRFVEENGNGEKYVISAA